MAALAASPRQFTSDDVFLMRNASQTVLASDRDYITLLEAQSTWPMKYRFGTPQPVGVRDSAIRGQMKSHMADGVVPTYNTMLPNHVRFQMRASQNRLHTELYGRAPIMTNRGQAKQMDLSSQLRQSTVMFKTNVRKVMEETMNRPDFVTMPRQLVELPETRFGRMTRAAPTYTNQP